MYSTGASCIRRLSSAHMSPRLGSFQRQVHARGCMSVKNCCTGSFIADDVAMIALREWIRSCACLRKTCWRD